MNILTSRGEADFDLYPYTPSASAGYAFLVFFGVGGLVHLCMLFPLRAWFFIPFVFGCAGEAAGYYGRAWSHSNIRNGSPYLLQLMLILASAPLLAASIYMTLLIASGALGSFPTLLPASLQLETPPSLFSDQYNNNNNESDVFGPSLP